MEERPYYEPIPVTKQYALNSHILKWWGREHDELLIKEIKKLHWLWVWDIYQKVVDITDPITITRWQKGDPKCKTYAWYNVLMYFCAARAHARGYHKLIRMPQVKECAYCHQLFAENSISPSLAMHLGINQLDICENCIHSAYNLGSNQASEEGICKYLSGLYHILNYIPAQNTMYGAACFTFLSTKQRVQVLQVLKNKPSVKRVKEVYGSWLNALIQASVLPSGTRKMPRGVQCLARDGHVCNSLGEKEIDDLLFSLNIPHEKEPHYPDSNYRADFLIGEFFIEYFGLAGDPSYDAKTKIKIEMCRTKQIKLISLYADDLWNLENLQAKLQPAFDTLT